MFTIEDTPHGAIVGAAASAEVTRYLATTDRPYFFSTDTMRWFGTRNVKWYGGIIAVGTDTKAPEGYPRHWARIFTTTGEAVKLAEGHGRDSVVAWAKKASREILAEDDSYAWRLNGWGGVDTIGVDCTDDCDH